MPSEAPPPAAVTPLPEEKAVLETPPTEPPVEVSTTSTGRVVAIWAPPPGQDALAAAQFLADRPGVRVTVLFPEHFFNDEEKSKRAKGIFQTLVSSKQVEVVLTLPERPVLPLVMDTANARASSPAVTSLPLPFVWPNDVVEQISLAREAFRRRWRVAPAGVQLPWGVALGPEFPLIAKFKIDWAVTSASGPTPAVIEGFKIPVLRPALLPISSAARKDWVASHAQAVLRSFGTVGPVQFSAVEDVNAFDSANGTGTIRWSLLSEAVPERVSALEREAPPLTDFSPWIGDPEENRAWELLGIARRSVETYQNSGAANLHSLELAKRSLHSAESGVFFDSFGAEKDTEHTDDVARDFLATLAQVYQILGEPMPPEISQGFARKGASVPAGEQPGGDFEREGSVLRWRDTLHDDRGPGDYFYPTGSQFPGGAWDLLKFEVRPMEEQVTFVFDMAALPNPGKGPSGFSLPMVDLYIDINHSPGAGSQSLLPGRPGMVEAGDAWEYALSVDGWGARLFASLPGQEPRGVGTFAVAKTSATAFEVTLPRRLVRGDPESWGYAVVVMGRSFSGTGPMSVSEDPGPDHFGGGAPGREAPPFIDLLVPAGQSQRRILGAYKYGQEITIPFVRSEP